MQTANLSRVNGFNSTRHHVPFTKMQKRINQENHGKNPLSWNMHFFAFITPLRHVLSVGHTLGGYENHSTACCVYPQALKLVRSKHYIVIGKMNTY